MTRDEAFRTFQETLAEILDIAPEEVTPDKVFEDDLDVDSLAFAELTIALEEALGVEIPDPEPEQVKTVEGAFAFIAGLLDLQDVPA